MRLHALVTCIFIVFLVYRLHTVMYKCMYVYMYMQVIHVNSFQYLELRFRKPWLKTIGSVTYLLNMASVSICVSDHTFGSLLCLGKVTKIAVKSESADRTVYNNVYSIQSNMKYMYM